AVLCTVQADGVFIADGGGTNAGTLQSGDLVALDNLKIGDASVNTEGTFVPTGLSGNRTYTLPDKNGTIALTNDIEQADYNETSTSDPAFIKNKPWETSSYPPYVAPTTSDGVHTKGGFAARAKLISSN